jgi:hypothetical protein
MQTSMIITAVQNKYPWHELLMPTNIPSWFLVAVGSWAGYLALRTLRAIKRQADTFVSKEKARVTVEIKPFKPDSTDNVWFVEMAVTNGGSTNAFIGPAICLPCINAANWDTKDAYVRLSMNLPAILKPNETITFKPPIQHGNDLKWNLDVETIGMIVSGFSGIFIIGLIEYKDVFGSRWSLKFGRKWSGVISKNNNEWLFTDWKEYDPLDANGEYKICEPGRTKRLWRRLRGRDPNSVHALRVS